MRWMQIMPRRSGRRVKSWWRNLFSSLHCKQRTVPERMEWRNEMIEQTDLAGNFTLPGTSITVNRMGYGAMQLAGRDGNKLVWGASARYRCSDRCSTRGRREWGEPHRYIRLLRSPCHQPDHSKGAASLSRRSGDCHESQRPAR